MKEEEVKHSPMFVGYYIDRNGKISNSKSGITQPHPPCDRGTLFISYMGVDLTFCTAIFHARE